MHAASYFLAAMAGIMLLYFFYKNTNRKIERYYFKENRLIHALLVLVNFLLAVVFVMHTRQIVLYHIKNHAKKLIKLFKK